MNTRPQPNSGHPSLAVLGGRHLLTIRELTVDQESFTLHYTVSPPLPDEDGDGIPMLVMEAEDDLGNAYVDWGGLYGPGPEGSCTNGSVTGQPAPPAGAHVLRVRVTFLRGGDEFPCDLTLPLHGATGLSG